MADAVVTISAALAAALDAMSAAVGRSRAELVREAIARYVIEERLAIDRVVAERLRQSGLADDGDAREGEPTGGEVAAARPVGSPLPTASRPRPAAPSLAPGQTLAPLRAYWGGKSISAPRRSAACQPQRGSSRKPRASATRSALPSATIVFGLLGRDDHADGPGRHAGLRAHAARRSGTW